MGEAEAKPQDTPQGSAPQGGPEVPLFREVRAARTSFERARQASLDLAEVAALLGQPQGTELPEHEAFYRALAARWGLTAPPRPLQTALVFARAALQPVAATFAYATEQLVTVQKEQKDALSAPEHRQLLEALEGLQHTLQETSTERAAMSRRSAALRPQARVLLEMLEAIAAERAQGAASPARAAAMLQSAREALLMVTGILGLELVLEPIALEDRAPEDKAPEDHGPDWARMTALEQRYREVHARLLSLADEAEARQVVLETEYNRAQAELHERFG